MTSLAWDATRMKRTSRLWGHASLFCAVNLLLPTLALFQPFPSLRVDRVIILEFRASGAGIHVNEPNPMDREGCSRSTLAGYLQEITLAFDHSDAPYS